ncbi:MAG TPA: efflux RND transporter periplasmic adaptor subunit, partial [Bacteroidia bacterium]|nr:efflux RND transporter periplasmic adaptor subunit [Bacteroidia bacterium]
KAEASGNVIYIDLPEGATVNEGALLLKVNSADLRAQFEKLKVDLKLALEVERRQHQLIVIGGISQQEYDISLAKYNSLKADSSYYQAQIAKTEVRAPFNGILGIRRVSIGSYITSAVTITHIYQTDPVKIDFTIPEKYSALFKVGDVIQFSTEGSSTIHEGKITVRDPQVDLESRSVHYLAVTRNPNALLLPGAFARVQLLLKNNTNAFFVPTESIVPVLNGTKVYLIKNGKAEEQLVKTGLRTEDYVQVLSGLSPGDSIVVSGNFQLKQGARLKIITDKKKKEKI